MFGRVGFVWVEGLGSVVRFKEVEGFIVIRVGFVIGWVGFLVVWTGFLVLGVGFVEV